MDLGAKDFPRLLETGRSIRCNLASPRFRSILPRKPVTFWARRANSFGLPESCQAPKSKIFLFTGILICGKNSPSPCHHEGRFAVVTKRGAGCDGLLAASGACTGRHAAAVGEVVWSWRRDPGVYSRWPVLAG